VPEIANVFRRCRIPFFQVTGSLENDSRYRFFMGAKIS
jgi:hypothetical protein